MRDLRDTETRLGHLEQAAAHDSTHVDRYIIPYDIYTEHYIA